MTIHDRVWADDLQRVVLGRSVVRCAALSKARWDCLPVFRAGWKSYRGPVGRCLRLFAWPWPVGWGLSGVLGLLVVAEGWRFRLKSFPSVWSAGLGLLAFWSRAVACCCSPWSGIFWERWSGWCLGLDTFFWVSCCGNLSFRVGRVGMLELLGGKVGVLELLGGTVGVLELLGARVEMLELLDSRVGTLELLLGGRVGALGVEEASSAESVVLTTSST